MATLAPWTAVKEQDLWQCRACRICREVCLLCLHTLDILAATILEDRASLILDTLHLAVSLWNRILPMPRNLLLFGMAWTIWFVLIFVPTEYLFIFSMMYLICTVYHDVFNIYLTWFLTYTIYVLNIYLVFAWCT